MSRRGNQGRHQFVLGLESLESRQLLSAAGLPGHSVADVSRAVPAIHETLSGTLIGQGVVNPTSATHGTTAFTATGDIIGPSTFSGHLSYSLNKKGVTKYTGGSATLTGSLGDRIKVAFTGSGSLAGVTDYTIFIKGPVKGGAGAFKNAAGTFSGNGEVNFLTRSFTITLTVKLTRL
jgi:hypothetical protein